MLPFAVVKRQLAIMAIIPIPKVYLPSKLRNLQTLLNWEHVSFVFSVLLAYFTAPLYFLLFKANNFVEFIEVTFMVTVTLLKVLFYPILIWKRSDLLSLLLELEKTIELRSKDPEIRTLYSIENEKSQKFVKIYWNIFFIYVQCFIVPKVLGSFIAYFTSGLSNDSFQLVFTATYPWNWKNSMRGYLAVACVQYTSANVGILFMACILCFYIGFCKAFGAFILNINKCLTDLNDQITDKQQTFTADKRIEIIERFYDIIQFHSDTKQLRHRFYRLSILFSVSTFLSFTFRFVECFNNSFGWIITVLFGLSKTFLCTALLGLNVAVSMGNWLDVFRLMVSLSLAMIYVIVVCIFGDEMTCGFNEIYNTIDMLSYYELPTKIQKYLPMMIAIGQKPVHVEGHMNIKCNRPLVKQITNAAFSYFTILRKFS